MDVERLRRDLATAPSTRGVGRVVAAGGLSLRAALPGARIGDVISVRARAVDVLAEVVGFSGGEVVALPLGSLVGVGPDDRVESTGSALEVVVGEGVLGRVLDGLGRPLDGGGSPDGERRPARSPAPTPLSRRPVGAPLATGVRAIDGLLTLGRGQRIGLFAGSGVGKSTLLASLARGVEADVVVAALVGERGREVGDFVTTALGPARARSVVVAATSDAPAVERLRAAEVATTVAEFFRDQGKSVLLLVDSVTRVARAQRDVGLAAGELPARRGFPPSVFEMLPRLIERAGQSDGGAITGVYTVLVEGDDLDEPIADEVRGLLDGHVVLARRLAERGHYPAIDVPASVSRLAVRVTDAEHTRAASRVRRAMALLEQNRDLIALGGHRPGENPELDRALALTARLEGFCRQGAAEVTPLDATVASLRDLAAALDAG